MKRAFADVLKYGRFTTHERVDRIDGVDRVEQVDISCSRCIHPRSWDTEYSVYKDECLCKSCYQHLAHTLAIDIMRQAAPGDSTPGDSTPGYCYGCHTEGEGLMKNDMLLCFGCQRKKT